MYISVRVNTTLPSNYKCGIMLVLMRWCFLRDVSPFVHMLSSLLFFSLANCALSYKDDSSDIR